MNFAFPALLIFLIALPGIVLRYTYRTGTITSPFRTEPLSEQLTWGVILAPFLHALWISAAYLMSLVCDVIQPVDLDVVLSLLTQPKSDLSSTISQATSHPWQSFFYFISITTAAFFGGHGAHWLVRKRRWDHSYPFLRFDNPWWYLLSGERALFPDEDDDGNDEPSNDQSDQTTPLVTLSAIVEQGGGNTFLYEGVVNDFYFEDGTLDRIELLGATRMTIPTDDKAKPAEPYKIPGRYFLLKYSSIRELNIRYRRLEFTDAANPAPAPAASPDPLERSETP